MWSRAISFEQGYLTASGLSARDLAMQFGTPTFFIDEDHFRERARAWSQSPLW
jgi:diaminopimelate decarboxylase